MKNLLLLACLSVALSLTAVAAETEPGFTTISDGKSFAGWKMANENKDTWKLEEGAFVADNGRL